MSRTRLSKVTITPRSTWDAKAEYKRLDAVSNGGASWLAKRDNTGVTPVEGDDWMNMVSITKESVVDALGFEPEKPENDYKLIEEITMDEDAVFVRTAKPDGTPYNFRRVFMKYTRTGGIDEQPTTLMLYMCDDTTIGYGHYKALKTSSQSFAATWCYAENGYWWSEKNTYSTSTTAYGSTAFSGPDVLLENLVSSYPCINKIMSNGAIISGTTIQIYAVEA